MLGMYSNGKRKSEITPKTIMLMTVMMVVMGLLTANSDIFMYVISQKGVAHDAGLQCITLKNNKLVDFITQ